jgi:hypothetical protein
MKNAAFLFAAIMALLAACASSPASSGTDPAPDVDATAPFDGLWELPNGQLQIFRRNAFILMDNEGTAIDTGIFTYTDTQFYLNLEIDFYVQFDYAFESGNLMVSGSGNEWAHGIWKKVNNTDSSDNPLVGYWEYTSEDEIRILHILPFGWGTWYTCDLNYNLADKSIIRYEDNNRSEFRHVISSEDFSISFPINYEFNGADLIVGTGNRYVRR